MICLLPSVLSLRPPQLQVINKFDLIDWMWLFILTLRLVYAHLNHLFNWLLTGMSFCCHDFLWLKQHHIIHLFNILHPGVHIVSETNWIDWIWYCMHSDFKSLSPSNPSVQLIVQGISYQDCSICLAVMILSDSNNII